MKDRSKQVRVDVRYRERGFITLTKIDGYPGPHDDEFRFGFVQQDIGRGNFLGDDRQLFTLHREEAEELLEALQEITEAAAPDPGSAEQQGG